MKSLEELKEIREKMEGEIGQRSDDSNKTRVVVGMATCGIASGARPVLNRLSDDVQEDHLDNVVVSQTGCIGLCQYEPIVEVFEPGKPKVTYVKRNSRFRRRPIHVLDTYSTRPLYLVSSAWSRYFVTTFPPIRCFSTISSAFSGFIFT